jgi:large subunit ribosomal protein L10
MSKPVKEMIMRDYKSRLEGFEEAMLISIRGVGAIDTTRLRSQLAGKDIKVTVIRNSLGRKVMEGTALEPLSKLLTGPSAIAYGGQSVVEVAREIVRIIETIPTIELKGAILDGQVFEGKAGVTELSKFPTREEAIGRIITLVVSPAQNLLSQVQGPGSTVAGILKTIEEKLEKGEAIAKAG